jgi:hypothetical protein
MGFLMTPPMNNVVRINAETTKPVCARQLLFEFHPDS